jgi:hypothetical protein
MPCVAAHYHKKPSPAGCEWVGLSTCGGSPLMVAMDGFSLQQREELQQVEMDSSHIP